METWLADIYNEHRRGLYALALSIARRPEAAEDAVHDAFAKVARLKARPDGDPVSYVFASVRNAALDGRKPKTGLAHTGQGGEDGVAHPLDFVESTRANPALAAENAEQLTRDKARLASALDTLASDDREIIWMRLWSNLDFKQIAEIHHEPLGTVATRYYRALAQLKKTLGKEAARETA